MSLSELALTVNNERKIGSLGIGFFGNASQDGKTKEEP